MHPFDSCLVRPRSHCRVKAQTNGRPATSSPTRVDPPAPYLQCSLHLWLLRSWRSLQRVLHALLGSAQSFLYLMLLLALLLFVFALLGMQLFGGRYTPPAFSLDLSTRR